MSAFTIQPGERYKVASDPTKPDQVHIFDQPDIDALSAAEAARRPLLVRGEPGVGKSQLALAAAVALGRGFVQKVVDIRTEPQDLLWRYDAVARLADAQMIGAMAASGGQAGGLPSLRSKIEAPKNYISPGVFWWAFQWADAAAHAAEGGAPAQLPGCDPEKGVVVLIDEIDKAESDLPNGLLEVLGANQFMPDFFKAPVKAAPDRPPLVVITTNNERELPAAFLRRCVVHEIRLPHQEDELASHLQARGGAHFTHAQPELLEKAAKLVIRDRRTAQQEGLRPLPGQAEYIDLLRAVLQPVNLSEEERDVLLERLSPFFLKKHATDDS